MERVKFIYKRVFRYAMHILTDTSKTMDMTIYGLEREPRLQGIIPKDFFSKWGLIKYDTAFADKVIRRCKKSLYEDYLHSWENDSSDPNWPVEIRQLFYKNQIRDEDISLNLHDHTIMVTLDGLNGAGKSTLQQLLEMYFSQITPKVLYGRSGKMPQKISNAGPESIHTEMEYHRKKVEEGERALLHSMDFTAHLLQYALALTRYAKEQPPLLFLDRSYLTSLAKASDFVHSREKEIFRDEPPGDDRKDYRKLMELDYLIHQMKDKYVIPDLSVILLCDKKTSLERQRQRGNIKKVDALELEWYYFFRKGDLIPNALYLDTTSMSMEEEFREVVAAIKERCEDKEFSLADEITETSVSEFIKSNLVKA